MIHLRPVEEKDLPRLLDWRNQSSVRQFMFTNHVISREEHYNWFEGLKDDPTRLAFICEDEGPTPFGFVQFKQIDPVNRTAHWGFFVGDRLRKGIGLELGKAAIVHAGASLELEQLYGEVMHENVKSRGFHEKLGFELVDSFEHEETGAKGHRYRLIIASPVER